MAIALTGAGVTALFAEAERRGVLEELRQALASDDDRLPRTEAAGRAQAPRV